MNSENLDNVNPRTYAVSEQRGLTDADIDDSVIDPFDTREIFDLIRDINDPEHPLTLEQLNVVTEEQVGFRGELRGEGVEIGEANMEGGL